jgi:hypothetical protein
MRNVIVISVILLLAGISFSGCVEDSYFDSCTECTFDESGKMDESCREKHEDAGTACLVAAHPQLTYLYMENKCPELNDCHMEAESCRQAAGTGSDRKDCMNPSVRKCFQRADSCISRAVSKCDARSNPCAVFILLPAILGLVFFFSSREEGL